MFRTRLFPTSIRVLALLAGCASLGACWWDGNGSTSPTTYTVGGSITGLTVSGLVLANGTDHLNVAANATSFAFPTSLAANSTYAVTVFAQPSGATCVVANGSGTVSGAVTSVNVTCTAGQFHIGGSLNGLNSSGLTLANGADRVSPGANATSFVFPTTVASGATYGVTVSAQPAGLNCSVTAGSGTVGGADVTSVAIACVAAKYHVGGTITGLSAAGLVLANGGDTASPAANATAFTMPATVASGTTYSVTVQTQPTGLTCSITGGSGTVSTADVTNISVSCSNGTGFIALAGPTSCPAGNPDQNGTGSSASLPVPYSLVVDGAGNLYTAGNTVIDKITPAGVVTTLAGQLNTPGYTDGPGATALMGGGIVGGVDAAGNLYVSESSNIRRITPAGIVSTLAGPAGPMQGYMDGTGSSALFEQAGLGVSADGSSWVSDYANHVIRKVTPAGVVTTFAGQHSQPGDLDGVGAAAQFESPQYLAIDASGTMYVADNTRQVRKIAADGTVTTLAGGTVNGWADGPGASALFYDIRSIAIGPAGSIYVMDQAGIDNGSGPYSGWSAIRQITPDGNVKTVLVSSAVQPAFLAPPGNYVTIPQIMQAMGSNAKGGLFIASECAVGALNLP